MLPRRHHLNIDGNVFVIVKAIELLYKDETYLLELYTWINDFNPDWNRFLEEKEHCITAFHALIDASKITKSISSCTKMCSLYSELSEKIGRNYLYNDLVNFTINHVIKCLNITFDFNLTKRFKHYFLQNSDKFEKYSPEQILWYYIMDSFYKEVKTIDIVNDVNLFNRFCMEYLGINDEKVLKRIFKISFGDDFHHKEVAYWLMYYYKND
jgi:hypothetical protein